MMVVLGRENEDVQKVEHCLTVELRPNESSRISGASHQGGRLRSRCISPKGIVQSEGDSPTLWLPVHSTLKA